MWVWQDASSAHVRGHVSVGKARRMTGFLVLSLYAGVWVLEDQFWNWWRQRCRPSFSAGLHVILHHYVPQFLSSMVWGAWVLLLWGSAQGRLLGRLSTSHHRRGSIWLPGDTWQEALPLHGGVSESLLGFPTPGVSQGVGGHTPLSDDLWYPANPLLLLVASVSRVQMGVGGPGLRVWFHVSLFQLRLMSQHQGLGEALAQQNCFMAVCSE